MNETHSAKEREDDQRRSRSRSPEPRRSTSIAITIDASRDYADHEIAIAISLIEITPISIAISTRKCDVFWVLFVFLGMNDIMYSFGNWENVRKYEQQVENVFSMVFSRTQPNIRKYFPKHFLKCNQTHKNIFFSEKYLFSGNTFTRTKRSLTHRMLDHSPWGNVLKEISVISLLSPLRLRKCSIYKRRIRLISDKSTSTENVSRPAYLIFLEWTGNFLFYAV